MKLYRTAILAAATAIVLSPSLASATGYYPPVYVPTPPVRPAPPVHTPSGGGSGGGNWHLCPTPAGIFICIVGAMIVIDEVKRSIDGPACATMKPRRSWFGMVKDEPRLWRPKCNWRDPAVKSAKFMPHGK